MKKAFVLLLGCIYCSLLQSDEEKPKFYLNEIAIGSGYAAGNLRKQPEQYDVIPFYVHLGFELNRAWGFPNHKGKLSFVLEPFFNLIIKPKVAEEVGFDVMFQYAYPIVKKLYAYGEIGAGPMYFGLKTKAQSAAGYNFLDQVGAGFKAYITKDHSLNFGYRYRHISHAKLRSTSNKGIDSHGVFISVSRYY